MRSARSDPFPLLCAAGLFAIFSTTISKSPALPLFAAHLGADPAEVGAIAAVSALAGIMASVPAGMLSDKLGRKRMLLFSSVIFATAPFMYLSITEIWQFVVVRFYHGFATAVFIPVSMAMISDLFHSGRGEKMGWFSTSTLAGRFMAPAVGGALIGAAVSNPAYGYKTVYIVCGAAGMMVFLLALMVSEPEQEKRDSPGWRETILAFKSVASNRGVLITSAVEAAILFAYGTFETFLPLYSIKSGLSAYAVGILLSAQVITLAITKPMLGRFSDRHGRRPQIFAGAMLGAVSIGSFSLFTSFIPLLALSILFGLSLSIVTSATASFIADLSERKTHGSAMGILGSVMDIGHTMGPLFSGIAAAHFGFGKAFIGASLVLVTAAMLFRSVKLKDGT